MASRLTSADIPNDAWFGYQSEEVAEAFTEYLPSAALDRATINEYKALRTAFVLGMNAGRCIALAET